MQERTPIPFSIFSGCEVFMDGRFRRVRYFDGTVPQRIGAMASIDEKLSLREAGWVILGECSQAIARVFVVR